MTPRLTITNGDSAVATLSKAGIPGRIIAWRDVLHEGPVDTSLPIAALSRKRARFIADMGWGEFAHVSGDFAERDRMIQRLDDFDEVVLWLEDDLYDQLQMIQLLDFLGARRGRRKKVSLIVVDGYIPPLAAIKIRQLDDARPAVTPEQFDLARRAWKAFGSADPSSISRLLAESTSALPYLAAALWRHLEEFPAVGSGLSRSEREALAAIERGHTTPVAAFLEVGGREESIFLGDIIFYSYLERLSGRKNALLTWTDRTPVVAPTAESSREFVRRELSLTPLGREVLAGARDWQTLNPRPRWLGGVRIAGGGRGWRWDADERTLVEPRPAGTSASRAGRPATGKKKVSGSQPPKKKKAARAIPKRSARRKKK